MSITQFRISEHSNIVRFELSHSFNLSHIFSHVIQDVVRRTIRIADNGTVFSAYNRLNNNTVVIRTILLTDNNNESVFDDILLMKNISKCVAFVTFRYSRCSSIEEPDSNRFPNFVEHHYTDLSVYMCFDHTGLTLRDIISDGNICVTRRHTKEICHQLINALRCTTNILMHSTIISHMTPCRFVFTWHCLYRRYLSFQHRVRGSIYCNTICI